MIALLVSLPALAAPAAEELRAWSDTAVELRPDAFGDGSLRAVERLGLAAPVGEAWTLVADGGVRLRQRPYDDLQLDLVRLGVQTDTLQLGRHVRLDPRGLQRLDGVSGRVEGSGGLAGEAWAGRLWHPALWASGTTLVTGAQLTARPMTGGRPSRMTHLTVGAEGRVAALEASEESLVRARTHLAAATATPTGHRADGLVEVEPQSGARGHLRATVPAGRDLDLGAEVRWEDLAPATSPYGVATPLDWLSPRGYGVGHLTASLSSGRWSLGGHGGPSVRRDGAIGGLGRLALRYGDGAVTTGVFASAAGLDGAWLAGGGAAVGYAAAAVLVHADLGVYRHQGLDGGADSVWEGRLEGRVPLREGGGDLRRRVHLAMQTAAGTDRQLARWVRGGVALHAELSGRRAGASTQAFGSGGMW